MHWRLERRDLEDYSNREARRWRSRCQDDVYLRSAVLGFNLSVRYSVLLCPSHGVIVGVLDPNAI